MARLYDMCKMSVTGSPGTGTFTLSAAVTGFQTFAAGGAIDGDIVSYSALGTAGWEVGRGTLGSSATTLTRGPLFSSNANAAVNFGSDVVVWIAALAEDIIQRVNLVGNTAGTSAPIISPTLAFAGGANITVSGTSNSISIIGATAAAAALSIYAVGNTTSSVSSGVAGVGSLSFDGAGIVSIGISNSSIVISAPSPAASGTIVNEYVRGNTTALSSSTTQTISSVSYSGAGIVSVGFSTTAAGAGALVISAPESQGSLSLYAVGNTTVSSSTSSVLPEALSLSGTGNITIGYSSNTIIFSGGTAAAGAQSLFASGNTTNSESSGVAGAGSLTFEAYGDISVGVSNSKLILSTPDVSYLSGQSGISVDPSFYNTVDLYATNDWFAVGVNTVGTTSSSHNTVGAYSLSGAGVASVGFSDSSIIISVPAGASGVVQNQYAIGNTTLSSSTTQTLSSISVSGAGGVTAGFTTGGAGGGVLVISGATTVASGTDQNRSAAGNTFGQSSSAVGTLTAFGVSATGGISAGFSTDASSGVLMLSVTPPVASGVVGNFFASGNTTAISSSSTHTLSDITVIGSGIISVGVSTTGAAAGALLISAPASQGSLSLYAVGNTTISSSTSSVLPESLSISGAGIISVGYSSNTILLSATATPTDPLTFIGQSGISVDLFYDTVNIQATNNWIAVGNTTGTTSSSQNTNGTHSISGAGIVSVGFSNSSLVISASTAATNPLLSVYAVGNTTSDASSGVNQAGSLSFDGAGIVSVGVAGSSVVISAPTPAASGTVGNYFASGNTTAISSSSTHTLSNISISGAGIVSVGVSTTGAGAGIIVVSAPTPAASQGSLSLFAVGNTTISSSTSSVLPEALSLSGAGIITVGYSSNTILLSATAPDPLTYIGQSGVSLDLFYNTLYAQATNNWVAVGNTTGTTSSSNNTEGVYSVSGAGIASIGFSNSSLIVSATSAGSLSLFAVGNTTISSSTSSVLPEALSLSGAGIVTVGYSSNTVLLSATVAASGTADSIRASGNTFGESSSAVGTLGSLTVSATGGISAGFSTAANSGILMLSVTPPVASGVVGNFFASGNTTAISSSSSHTLSNITVIGSGIVSVGISTTGAAAGAILISASTAATNPLLSLFAVGNTTSSVSSGVNAAGSLSFDGAGIVSVGISNSSVVISAPSPAASGVVGNFFASGNTTAISSSSSHTLSNITVIGSGGVSVGVSTTGAAAGALLISAPIPNLSLFAVGNTTVSSSTSSVLPEALSFSGAGIVTVGYSSNTILLSASTAASAGSLSLFAVGNTTISSSTSSALPEALSFSATGPLSIGYSSNTIILSAATIAAGPQTIFAVGTNTAGTTTSAAIGAGSISFSANGALSVGLSDSSIVMSMPATSSLVGTSGVTLSTNGSTISVGEQLVSYFEPRLWVISATSVTTTWPIGTMAVQPFVLQAPLSINQIDFFSSRAVVAPAMSFGSSTASRTATASATWGSTASLVIYSQQDGTSSQSFTSFSSTTASFGMSAVLSGSFSSSSKTFSQTVTFGWPQGTSAGVTSSMSTTFSHVSSTAASTVMHTSSSLFANWLRNDYPFAASFLPGQYLLGIMWSSASGSSTLSTGLLTMSPPTWLGSNGIVTMGPGTSVIGVPGAAISNPFPGVGSTSSAGSAVPGTVAWRSISSGASHAVNYFYMIQG